MMTVDTKCYDFAKVWLQASGLTTYSGDYQRLAEHIQSVCEDYEADLEKERRHAS